jgi:cytochrome P450
VFSIRYPFFGHIVYFADPEAVREIFTGDPSVFHAGEGNAGPLEPIVGQNSLLTLDGDAHIRQRKLMLPPFHGERIARYVEAMRTAAERELAKWPVGRPFALRPRMQEITLEVILRTIFGVNDAERLMRFSHLTKRLDEVSNSVLWLPAIRRDLGRFSPWRRFLEARGNADRVIYSEIKRRREEPGEIDRDDVMAMLLRARHEDGSAMSDLELRDELMTLVAAGHETTATGLCWSFELLLRHPRVERTLRANLDDDAYLDAVVKEVLRLRPVVADVVRKVKRDVTIAGHAIPAGKYIVPAIALVHLRPDVYEDPHEFRPERFLEGAPEPYTWIPFGGGVRRCIGASFAQQEIKVVLRTLLAGGRFRSASPRPEAARTRHVTIVPSRGARVVLEERLRTVS